ncbi:MAG TPA: helix-hairpin-helix domain-containing protein [Candidatus Omnitrophota bacterium]|jgi:competence ComEA-like helix-hairpin-helix protein|nr:helix-hairpin-helix domain-containing protein [Candidatus Omnitrophota bacterium]HPN57013.1 helix-hairpin-helix domain-containing protein [Candidatus Omnitrophota bacterium]
MVVHLTRQERLVLCYLVGVLSVGTGLQGLIKGRPDTLPREQTLPGREPGGKLDINSASEEELVGLPCVGPVMARRIMAYRREHGPFHDLSQLKEIKGIGRVTYFKLGAHVTIPEPNP